MKICKRCKGAGNFFRPNLKLPMRLWFKKCGDCGGLGIKPKTPYPATIRCR